MKFTLNEIISKLYVRARPCLAFSLQFLNIFLRNVAVSQPATDEESWNTLVSIDNPLSKDFSIILLNEIIFNNHKLTKLNSISIIDYEKN